MSKENIHHCAHFGAEIRNEGIMVFDGKVLCSSCLNRKTLICEHCGERIWLEDNAGDSTITLCRDCRGEHYTTCERCGCIIHEDYANYIGDEPYCDDCYDR